MLVNVIAGTVVGLLATALLYTLHFAGLLKTGLGSQLLFLALAFHITGLIAALGYHRHRAGEGGAPFARLFGAGLMVSLFAGVVLAAGTHLFVTVVEPGYLDWLKASSLERLAASELPAEEQAAHRGQIEQLTPLGYAVQTLISTLIAGFFLSLTLAAFLRMRTLRSA